MTMTSTEYRPWSAVGALSHITVAVMRLPGKARSWWLPAEQAIVLDDRLTQVERRCSLAHELVHAERGDLRCENPRVELRQEQYADKLAAQRLISIERLGWALAWSVDEREVADELAVDMATLRNRLNNLTKAERDGLQAQADRFQGGPR